MRLQYCALLLTTSLSSLNNFVRSGELGGAGNQDVEKRIYDFKKLGGSTCAYTASWLAHVNLFRRVTWWVDSTKMEAASFQLFDAAKNKFQVSDPDAYYVHHMSAYEHLLHRKVGYEVAKNETITLSKAAIKGECDNLIISDTNEYLALIPFFGGLPPDVTADLKVKSIGQGNSLMAPDTKALLCMATLCSTLRYYGHAVIGVVRDHDKELMIKMLDQMDPAVKAHTQLVQLKMPKPANLPFHLLAWGAEYVKNYNCGLMLHEKGKKTKRKLEKIKNESNIDNKIENDNADKSYIGRILSNIMMPISNIKWNFVPSVSLKSEVEEKVEEKVEKTVATSDVDITSIVSTKSLNIPVEPDVSATDVVMTAKGMGDSSIGLRNVDAGTGTGVSTGVGASAQTGGAFMTNVNTTTLPHSSAAESPQTLHPNKNENNEKKDNKIEGFESGIIISVNNDVDVSTSKSYVSDHPLMAICGLKGTAQHRGAVINMTYFRPSIIHTLRYGKNSEYENTVPAVLKSADTGRVTHKRTKTSEKNIKRIELEENKVKNEEITEEKLKENKEGTGKEGGKAGTKVEVKMKVKEKLNENNRKTHSDWSRNRKLKKRHDIVPIQFIYYTECDQIVKYDTMGTLKAFSSALNESTFLTGRRREKSPETSAVDYMGGINQWRECGTPGYSMTYPTDVNIRKNSNRRNLNVDIDNNINNYEFNKKVISYYKSMMNYFV